LASAYPQPGLRRQADLSKTSNNLPLIAVTSGEPAGIGPDICLRLAAEPIAARLVVLGDRDLFASRAAALIPALSIQAIDRLTAVGPHRAGRLILAPVPLAEPAAPGKLNPANSPAVLRMLEIAAQACMQGDADAIVTAPVQKSVINAAGLRFSGHTEFLAQLTGIDKPVMLLTSQSLRVALVTTHLPLAEVPAAINRETVAATLRIVDQDLRQRFGIAKPRIHVLGLNPHAGENGVLGREEIETIAPVIAELQRDGLEVHGPIPADSAFTPAALATADVVVAMYHDQGLPVIKSQDFGEIVNVTLGLPIVRTSVDHGTALTLAGTGRAQHSSLRAAVELAIELARIRHS